MELRIEVILENTGVHFKLMNVNFLDLFRIALDLDTSDVVEYSDDFREFDSWSSLSQLSLIAEIDEHYGVLIDDEDFQKLKTVGDIHEAIMLRTKTA